MTDNETYSCLWKLRTAGAAGIRCVFTLFFVNASGVVTLLTRRII